jgi:protein gp37
MAATKTGIEWTDKTWNPTVGCDKVSLGCGHCYAEALTKRFPKTFKNEFNLTLHPERLTEPLKWRKPCKVFVNSMSDLFHKDVPLEFIQEVFDICKQVPQHTFQILTKRHERLVELASQLEWHSNIWMGVSVENQKMANERIPALLKVPSAIRFLSVEPMLGEIDFTQSKVAVHAGNDIFWVDWVICGGESGIGHRPIKIEWVRSLRDQCQKACVPFFFKQWGGHTPKAGGNELDGVVWQQFPEVR